MYSSEVGNLLVPRTEALKRVSFAATVYDHLLGRILRGEMIPGDIIDRIRLASELQVSQAPVAEAIYRLAAEGLLELLPRKNTRVRLIRREDVRGQFALRLALERQAVMMCHGQAVREAKETLLELAREVDKLPAKNEVAWPAEIAFHQALVDLAQCPALSEAFIRVMRRNYFFAIHSAHIPMPQNPGADQHSLLVKRLCSDDPARADQAILAHFSRDATVLLRPQE